MLKSSFRGTSVALGSVALLASLSCRADQSERWAALDARMAQLEARLHRLETASVAVDKTVKAEEADYQPGEGGWDLSGGGKDVYAVRVDRGVTRGGHPTARLTPLPPTRDRYGTFARHLDATSYRDKRVRFSAWVKTQGTTARADFWARVQAADSAGDGPGLGGHWTFLPPTSDWTQVDIVLQVDPRADYFNYGFGIAGPGRLWFDEPKIEIVGDDVPVTPLYPGEVTVAGWTMTGVGAPDYTLVADGKGVRIERKVASSSRWVAVLRAVPAEPFRGKKPKASLQVHTDGLESEGQCILKVQRQHDLAYQGFLGVDTAAIPASTKSAHTCAMSAAVTEDAGWILYGFTYRGPGTARIEGGALK